MINRMKANPLPSRAAISKTRRVVVAEAAVAVAAAATNCVTTTRVEAKVSPHHPKVRRKERLAPLLRPPRRTFRSAFTNSTRRPRLITRIRERHRANLAVTMRSSIRRAISPKVAGGAG
jgi:hypothetical protein